MKSIVSFSLLIILSFNSPAQKHREVSISFINTGTAYPFGQFGKLLTNIQHPGAELGYSFNWKTKSKHDWYQELKLAYFYHRFVQHAIPLYTDVGYRYKFQKLTVQAALGLGYMHSIPATATLKLTADGAYKNNKGIGRPQAMAVGNWGINYLINASGKRPLKVFTTYQQFLQTPFVKSYVPILPYNSIMIGFSFALNADNK